MEARHKVEGAATALAAPVHSRRCRRPLTPGSLGRRSLRQAQRHRRRTALSVSIPRVLHRGGDGRKSTVTQAACVNVPRHSTARLPRHKTGKPARVASADNGGASAQQGNLVCCPRPHGGGNMPIVVHSLRPGSEATFATPSGHLSYVMMSRPRPPTTRRSRVRWPQARTESAGRRRATTDGHKRRRICSLLPMVGAPRGLGTAGWVRRRPHRQGERGCRQRIGRIGGMQAAGVAHADATEQPGHRVSPKHRCVNHMASSTPVLTMARCVPTTSTDRRHARAGAALST